MFFHSDGMAAKVLCIGASNKSEASRQRQFPRVSAMAGEFGRKRVCLWGLLDMTGSLFQCDSLRNEEGRKLRPAVVRRAMMLRLVSRWWISVSGIFNRYPVCDIVAGIAPARGSQGL